MSNVYGLLRNVGQTILCSTDDDYSHPGRSSSRKREVLALAIHRQRQPRICRAPPAQHHDTTITTKDPSVTMLEFEGSASMEQRKVQVGGSIDRQVPGNAGKTADCAVLAPERCHSGQAWFGRRSVDIH